MDGTTTLVFAEMRRGLECLYGSRLREIILFGSRARGDADAESDYDVLVVLAGPVRPMKEILRTEDLVVEVSLRHDTVVSCVFIDAARYDRGTGPLVRNVRREGVPA